MILRAGSRLGPYEIVAPLGAGGMGEVYRAKDTRLDRAVALKVLPERLSGDAALQQRLQREARSLSALAHPNICALFDVGSVDGVEFLVMEYLEGETLAERLVAGPMAAPEAIRIAIHIAEALHAAHRRGVVHRDLKPGNVMLARTGVKLLDFGLAKPMVVAAASVDSQLLTEASGGPLTTEGTILGTFPYMAPEQLQGKEADARSDLFALGAVLYEMLTGSRPFAGGTQATLIAAILTSTPPSPSALRGGLDTSLDRLVARCLEKDPDARWQSAHDLAYALQELSGERQAPGPAAPRRAVLRERAAWTAGAVVLATIALLSGRRLQRIPEALGLRFEVPIPANAALYPFSGPVAISPDGSRLAFFARSEGRYVLFVRPLDAPSARLVPGTDNGNNAFWSPDSRRIGFFAEKKLKVVDAAGGEPHSVCDAPLFATAAWSSRGDIIFGTLGAGLARVPVSGGSASPLTSLDPARAEMAQLWPIFLPDGERFLFLAMSARPGGNGVYAGSLSSKGVKRILDVDSNIAYSRSGHVLFLRGGRLLAQPFDERRLETTGDAVPLTGEVWQFKSLSGGLFSISETRTLTWVSPALGSTQLVWFDKNGRRLGTVGTPGDIVHLDLSPDETQVACERLDAETGNGRIWLVDLKREITSRFRSSPFYELAPFWSRDGKRLAYGSYRGTSADIYSSPVSGSGEEERFVEGGASLNSPTDWSRDGRYLIYDTRDLTDDLKALPLTGEKTPIALLTSPANETQGTLSPDGRWLAYTSNESGREEVYLRTFPGGAEKWQVSSAGGAQPRWRRDSRALFYLAADRKLSSVSLGPGPAFEASAPVPLFETRPARFFGRMDYAVSADGERFLVNTRQDDWAPPRITVVTAWRPQPR